MLARKLSDLGLELHPEGSSKHLTVAADEWMRGARDFEETTDPVQWKSLVFGLKWLLIREPERYVEIQNELRGAGFRLPLPDYSAAVRERNYLQRIGDLVRVGWLQGKTRRLPHLISDAAKLRDRYLQETRSLLNHAREAKGYGRKRLLPRLRYRAGRLAYLAARGQLAGLALELRGVSELQLHAAVLQGIATGDVTEVLDLGANAVQAVAQALRAEGRSATMRHAAMDEVREQGTAVLALNGVLVPADGTVDARDSPLLRFAQDGVTPELMQSGDAFVRELACLHGLGAPRHLGVLETAFDVAEDAVFDMVSNQMASASG